MSTPDALKQIARAYQRIMGATYTQALTEVSSTPTAIYGKVIWQPQRLLEADMPPNIYGPAKTVKNLIQALNKSIDAEDRTLWAIRDCNSESEVNRRDLMASVHLGPNADDQFPEDVHTVVAVSHPHKPTTIEAEMICSTDGLMQFNRSRRREYLKANLKATEFSKITLDPVCFVGVGPLDRAASFFRAWEKAELAKQPTLTMTALGDSFAHAPGVRQVSDPTRFIEEIDAAKPGSVVIHEPPTAATSFDFVEGVLPACARAASRGVRIVIGWSMIYGDRARFGGTPHLTTDTPRSVIVLCGGAGNLPPASLRSQLSPRDSSGYAEDYADTTPTNVQPDDMCGLVKTSHDDDYVWAILPHEPPAPIAELVDALTADMVFISGPTGCGKTVALRSFIQRTRQQDPRLTILVLAEIPQALRLAPDDRIRYVETTQELTDILRNRYDGSKDVQPDPVMVVCDGLWGQSSPEHWETCLTYLSMHQPNGLPTLVVASQSRVSPSDLQSVERMSFDHVVFAGSSIVQGGFSPIGQDLLRQMAHSPTVGQAVLNPQSSRAEIVQVTYPE